MSQQKMPGATKASLILSALCLAVTVGILYEIRHIPMTDAERAKYVPVSEQRHVWATNCIVEGASRNEPSSNVIDSCTKAALELFPEERQTNE